MAETQQPRRRTMAGTVVSDKMTQTVVVAVETMHKHPLYGRTVRRTRKFKAHDPREQAHVGDRVLIAESRPISRDKHWQVVEVMRRGHVPEEIVEEIES